MPYAESVPCFCGDLFDGGFQPGESQEVHVAVLLLVLSIMAGWQPESMQWVVVGGSAIDRRVFFVAVRTYKLKSALPV